MHYLAVLVAVAAAGVHCYFAFLESFNWGISTVRKIAPDWVEGLDIKTADGHVEWARRLAFNVAAYNLMLAAGLAWTAYSYWAGQSYAPLLAVFFGIWLLAAAAAAFRTQVVKAFAIQGLLGVALLAASVFG